MKVGRIALLVLAAAAAAACGDIRRQMIVEQSRALDAGGPTGSVDPIERNDSDGSACAPGQPCGGSVSPRPSYPGCADGGCPPVTECPMNDPCQPYCFGGCTRNPSRYGMNRPGIGRPRTSAVGSGGSSSRP